MLPAVREEPAGSHSEMRTIAILSPSASEVRRAFWRDIWGGMRVPVVSDEPSDIIFPNGERAPGFFVDFQHIGAEGCKRFADYTREKPNATKVFEMVTEVGYPVKCDDVTVVRIESAEFYEMMKGEGWI